MKLDRIPDGAKPNRVEVEARVADGRPVLRVALDQATRAGKPGADYVDQPTFVILPHRMTDGSIDIDILGRLLPDAPDYARGFIGIAYRISDDLSSFESIYIRPSNGRAHAPGAPREDRAVQYYAYPDWPFDRLREQAPGQFESGADIALQRWAHLRIDLSGRRFSAFVDGIKVLEGEGMIAPSNGRIGLWVDIGTEGLFADLTLHAQDQRLG